MAVLPDLQKQARRDAASRERPKAKLVRAAVAGDFEDVCASCAETWPQEQLTPEPEGLLCPGCQGTIVGRRQMRSQIRTQIAVMWVVSFIATGLVFYEAKLLPMGQSLGAPGLGWVTQPVLALVLLVAAVRGYQGYADSADREVLSRWMMGYRASAMAAMLFCLSVLPMLWSAVPS